MNLSLIHIPELRKRMLLISILLPLVSATGWTQSNKLYYKESVAAGGPEHFIEARHVVIKGSNYQIGKKIGEIAKANGVQIKPSGEPLRNEVQREYMAKNYPIHYERMKGVADAFGLNIEDNAYDFSGISQYPGMLECSAIYYPGQVTENGHNILSRNFDLPIGIDAPNKIKGFLPPSMMKAACHPYIFEIYPDCGYPSLFLCAFDLLGGVLDGINSEGLVVAVHGDSESMGKFPVEPAVEVGVHEVLCLRFLLDNCKDCKQAKEAMLYLKHYYTIAPQHYIIADRYGNSFVFEFSALRNKTFIIDGKGPQYITNHLLSSYKSIDKLPRGDSFDRFKIFYDAVKKDNKFDLDEIKSINASVAAQNFSFPQTPYAGPRTRWHSIYDSDERSVKVKFYLGEKADPKDEKKVIINYSDYLEFRLTHNSAN